MITILQHGPGEAPGNILPHLTVRAVPFRILNLWENDPVPTDSCEPVIILGGLMSVNDEKEYPFLKEEKALVRTLAARNIPVLGICLGAQMIANAFGKAVTKAEIPELGWYTAERAGPGLPGHPNTYPVYEWHNETFALPEGAELLATGNPVRNQAFLLGSCIGVQYHMEATPEIIRNWARDLPAESRQKMEEDTGKHMDGCFSRCGILLDYFLSLGGRV